MVVKWVTVTRLYVRYHNVHKFINVFVVYPQLYSDVIACRASHICCSWWCVVIQLHCWCYKPDRNSNWLCIYMCEASNCNNMSSFQLLMHAAGSSWHVSYNCVVWLMWSQFIYHCISICTVTVKLQLHTIISTLTMFLPHPCSCQYLHCLFECLAHCLFTTTD